MNNNHLYNENSIESLSPLEFTRLRPQVYCGDTTYSTQLLIEILSNSIDEYNLGHGNLIKISVEENNTISVRDFGQGFIVNSIREDGKTILEAAFSVLNTSGKYREDGTYEGTSLGSFGIGSKLSNFLSHQLEVTSWRDGQYEYIKFIEGVFNNREVNESENREEHGTLVKWKPSEEFFTNVEVEVDKLRSLLKTTVSLCQGLTIEFNYKGNKETFYSENGLNDLVDDTIGKDIELTNRFILNYKKDKYKINLIMTYTDAYSSTIVPYVNTGLTAGGSHITQIKTILTREMNKFFRDKKWLKDKDTNLTGDDVQEGLYVIFNMTVPSVKYDSQIKTVVSGIDCKVLIEEFAIELKDWLERNEKDIKLLFDKAVTARKAREAAKKARDKARGLKKDKKNRLLNLPTKLVDCWSKDRELCELLISEGDSAASGLIGARDGEFQGVFPVRGKVINSFKATSDKVFANQEVTNIIKALGLDLDKDTGKLIYDKDDLRYGKILLAADADPDGQAIKNLLITLFWWLCPELVINGHLYATIPPLFRITTKKNEYIYLRDDRELEKYKKEHQGEKYQVNRNKG